MSSLEAALIAAVRLVSGAFAVILIARIVFTLFAANPDKWITRSVAERADSLTLGLRSLLTPADPMLAVAINYGIAALAWLVIGAIVVRILRAVFGRWSS